MMFFSLSACNSSNTFDDLDELVISVNEQQASELDELVDCFNNLYDGKYVAKLDVYKSEEIKNYMLKHHDVSGDLIAFDSFNTANMFGDDYLINLTLDDSVDKYQSSIISYIKDDSDRLFTFPGLGRFYGNCYNLDILKKYNFNVPSNVDELMILAKRCELKINNGQLEMTSSSIGGNESVLFALMQIAFPEFLSSVRGNYFIKEFKKNNVNTSDLEYSEYFKNIFRKFHQLYYNKYYLIDDINKNVSDGISDFVNGNSLALQTSIDYEYDDILNEMDNAQIYPFVGSNSNQEWIASKPLFYLSVNKNLDSNKFPMAKAFFNYFTSNEGQYIMSDSSARLESNKCFISYVRDVYLELGYRYQNMVKPIEDGKVFIVDTFNQIFGCCINEIIKYLNNEISVDDLLKAIDKRNYISNNVENLINVGGEFDFDDNKINKCETKIANYFTDTLRKYANVDAVFLNNDIINANIYSNGLYLSELDIILNNSNLIYKRMSVYEIKFIIKYFYDLGQIPLISGVRITNGFTGINITDLSGKALDNDDSIVLLIDEDILNYIDTNYEGSRRIELISTIKALLNNQSSINVPKLDNRYGNVNFYKDSDENEKK